MTWVLESDVGLRYGKKRRGLVYLPLSAVTRRALLAQYIVLVWRLGSVIDAVQISCSCSCSLALPELLLQSVSVEVSGSSMVLGVSRWLDMLDTLRHDRHSDTRHEIATWCGARLGGADCNVFRV